MLKLIAQEERWEEVLPGVRVLFRPITRKAWRAAQRAAANILSAAPADAREESLEDAGDEISYALLYRGIAAWEGVVGEDEQPVAATLDTPLVEDGEAVLDAEGRPRVKAGTISMFLADPIVFRACDRAYVLPYLERRREKNGSSASPNGIGEAATPAAATASSPAPPRKARAARRAPTRSRNRGAKPGS